jgi:hypothetical protein
VFLAHNYSDGRPNVNRDTLVDIFLKSKSWPFRKCEAESKLSHERFLLFRREVLQYVKRDPDGEVTSDVAHVVIHSIALPHTAEVSERPVPLQSHSIRLVCTLTCTNSTNVLSV